MGAFLGNLQVWGAAREEVAALLPRALVGQWSEHFVTVLDERYGMGTVDRPARKLSKELPEAVVLSVALSDSDLLELAVWQGGKRLTVRAHFPYDGVSKRGNPKKFCQAFRLPPEDERRLKAVWAKGNAEEQLDLTAALLGAPLYADPRMVPEGMKVRDTGRVDRWLAEHPDPPKVKNQTRAEEIQTLVGYEYFGWRGDAVQLRRMQTKDPGEGEVDQFLIGPDGPLIQSVGQEYVRYRYPSKIVAPADKEVYCISKFGPLQCKGEMEEIWKVEMGELDRKRMRQEFWLVRMDREKHILQRAKLPAWSQMDLGKLIFFKDQILLYHFDEGLWLLDRETLSVLAEIPDHRSYMDAAIDGADRFWIQIGTSSIEAYDKELRLLSRHRLKGEIMAWYLDDHGRLCVVTYSECKGKHDIRFDGAGDFYYPNFDPEKEIVRVYRLS